MSPSKKAAEKLTAQNVARALLADLKLCNMDSLSGSYICLHLYEHPDFYTALTEGKFSKKQVDKLSEEECDTIHDEYYVKYTRDDLPVEKQFAGHTREKITYMRALLEGITEGRITTGDSMLGSMLLEFTSHLKHIADQNRSEISRTTGSKPPMPHALAELYEQHFKGMQAMVYKGASLGLFTSGHPLDAPDRSQSMAEKYGGRKPSGHGRET